MPSGLHSTAHADNVNEAVAAATINDIAANLNRLSYDVKQYGALGDGSTNDTTAISNAIAAANTAGKGIVYFPAGTYIVDGNLPIYSNLVYQGQGWRTSIIKLKNAAATDADVFRSNTFPTGAFTAASATQQAAGSHEFVIRDLQIDGNYANNTNGRHGLAIYGAAYRLDNLLIRNCRGSGIWSEWNTANYNSVDQQGVGVAGLEAYVTNILLVDNQQRISAPSNNNRSASAVAAQMCFLGPHDSLIDNLIIYQTQVAGAHSRGLLLGKTNASGANSCTGTMANNVHIWGNHDVALDIAADGCFLTNLQAEGAGTGSSTEKVNIVLRANNTKLDGRAYLAAASSTALAWDSGSMCRITLEMEDMTTGTFVAFTGAGAYSNVFITCYNGGTLYSGSIPASMNIRIINAGSITSGTSFRQDYP